MSRLSNAIRCYASYARSRLFGVRAVRHMPLFVSVEPSNVCQLRCPECPVGQAVERKGTAPRLMHEKVWKRILEQVAACAYTIQFYFQGEPLLNPRLPQMIAEAKTKGLYTIISTNAQAMTPQMAEQLVSAGLNRIIISMDGATQHTYEAYRVGGSIEQCKAAMQWLKEAKKKYNKHTIIELQCLRLRTNEHEWNTLRRQYKALGADRLVFKTAQLYNYADGHPLMPSQPCYNRYTKGQDGYYHRKPLSKACFRVWSGCVITTDGMVLPCCYDKSSQYAYGNIMNADLRTLFTSQTANAFRQKAWREQPSICKECWK